MSGVTLDCQKAQAAFAKLLRVVDSLPQIAEQARAESLGFLIVASEVNIYATTSGKRPRTGHYRQGLDAQARSTKSAATITVRNDVDYAGIVELGRQGMTYAALQAMAAQSSNPHVPLTLGRSGANWTVAAPIVTGGQVFAALRMQELFVQKVRSVR